MDRRDFLSLRIEAQRRVAELSCAQLYVRYCDSRGDLGPGKQVIGSNYWQGEPPSELNVQTSRQLFDDLDRELRAVDIVHLTDHEWLVGEDFRREFEILMSAFRSRGGRVE